MLHNPILAHYILAYELGRGNFPLPNSQLVQPGKKAYLPIAVSQVCLAWFSASSLAGK
jgi:hypothetical protein